jgi:hypothetical protein
MREWAIPKTLKKIRGFLILKVYYHMLTNNYGQITISLKLSLKKEAFIVECDASCHGIGAVLMKEGMPLSFEIIQLKGKNLPKPIYEKQLLAILHAVKKWWPYLTGRQLKVKIDHDRSFKNYKSTLYQ